MLSTMGIPYLLQYLSPYATPFNYSEIVEEDSQDSPGHLKGEPGVKSPENAIIDGPAMAYHAYHQALGEKRRVSNALDATPCHSEVNAIAVRYLENLEKHGLQIAAIFFDGFLPQSKMETRLQRSAAFIKDLIEFKRVHSSNMESKGSALQHASPGQPCTFHTTLDTPLRLKSLPVLPLMVPAVIEAIQQSRFGIKTQVVPGEADEYCASFAKEYGGSIFTSDSDLLLYDLGEAGAVVLFKEVEIRKIDRGTQVAVRKYKTTQVARRLGLESLRPLAYAIQEDHHRGLGPCIEYARKLSLCHTGKFEEFVTKYSLLERSTPRADQHMQVALEKLDPRFSEWVTQFLNHKALRQSRDTQISFDMFLPFLIEDPARASAWRTGADIRRITYSVMCSSYPHSCSTMEYARKGTRISEQNVDHLIPSAVENTLAEWCSRWDVMSESANIVFSWRLMGMHSLCQQILQSEKPLPDQRSIYALLCGKLVGPTWEFLHLSASFQAALYSWRVLYQAMSVLLVTSESHVIMKDIDISSIRRLHKSLPAMPRIEELFTITEGIEDGQLEAYVSNLYKLLNVREHVSAPAANETSKRNKRKKEKDQESSYAEAKSSTPFASSNIYDLLSSTE